MNPCIHLRPFVLIDYISNEDQIAQYPVQISPLIRMFTDESCVASSICVRVSVCTVRLVAKQFPSSLVELHFERIPLVKNRKRQLHFDYQKIFNHC